MATEGPQHTAQALLDPIQNGTYPESENVLNARLGSEDLSATVRLLNQSREGLQAELQRVSSSSSSDVDKWISQARQLQQDIERSKRDARDIVQKHEASRALNAKVEEASAKVRFLHSETEYNEAVIRALEAITAAVNDVASVRTLIDQGDLKRAALKIPELEKSLEARISSENGERPWELVLAQLRTLRIQVLEQLSQSFDQCVHLAGSSGQESLTIRHHLYVNDGQQSMDDVLHSLEALGVTDEILSRAAKKVGRLLLEPLLLRNRAGSLEDSEVAYISLKPTTSRDLLNVLKDLKMTIDYIQNGLPDRKGQILVSKCLQHLVSNLISDWLLPSIPTELDDLGTYENSRLGIEQFAAYLSSNGYREASQLTQWITRIPRIWLTKRRTVALDRVRMSLQTYEGRRKTVERVERQKVSKAEDSLNKGGWDEWNSEWQQEKTEGAQPTLKQDDDVSGWDFEDEDEASSKAGDSAKNDTVDETSDAWGWDDDDDHESKDNAKRSTSIKTDENGSSHTPLEREIVLREVYTITEVPDVIIDLIKRQLDDAEQLSKDDFEWLRSAAPSAGLRALPALMLAMFRATALSFYESAVPNGNMHLYNDCLYLSEKYNKVAEALDISSGKDDVLMLQRFAKSAYGREMDLQRTVLGDLLDGAQGFSGCNEYPLSEACDTAVGSTVDHIRALYAEWKTVLSHSALLQSIGSLLDTVIDKVIKDVEDMEDISEAESNRLTGYCNQITKLDALFLPERGADDTHQKEYVPLTAVYVSDWLRFQYLANILESSLVDIKYLWTEGELSLEFSAEESKYLGAINAQIRLQLTTKDENLSLPDSTGPILVPTSFQRYGLSTLVNNLLSTEKTVPLEFLINGTYLRTSIDEFLTANGISAETTLTVEYVRALIPPLFVASFEHDDWVSAVDVLSESSPAGQWQYKKDTRASVPERILSASYDGYLRVWNTSSEVISTSPGLQDGGHSSAIKSAKWISGTQIASSGADRTVRLWKYSEDEGGFSGSLQPQLELYGHKSSVDTLSVHTPTNRILSASSDHSVGLWSTRKSDAPEAPSALLPSATSRRSKRRKLNRTVQVSQRGPLSLLKQHTAPVSEAIFDEKDSTVGYSVSWDHTLRTWDLVTTALVDTRTTSHSLLSVVHLPDLNLLAAGTTVRHITLIDPRQSAATVSAMTLRGHTNAVVSLARDPDSAYGLVSGSHDGICRIWDVRSTRTDKDGVVGDSIYSIPRQSAEGQAKKVAGEGVKVFGVCWDKSLGIVSVGEDKRVQINRGRGILSG